MAAATLRERKMKDSPLCDRPIKTKVPRISASDSTKIHSSSHLNASVFPTSGPILSLTPVSSPNATPVPTPSATSVPTPNATPPVTTIELTKANVVDQLLPNLLGTLLEKRKESKKGKNPQLGPGKRACQAPECKNIRLSGMYQIELTLKMEKKENERYFFCEQRHFKDPDVALRIQETLDKLFLPSLSSPFSKSLELTEQCHFSTISKASTLVSCKIKCRAVLYVKPGKSRNGGKKEKRAKTFFCQPACLCRTFMTLFLHLFLNGWWELESNCLRQSSKITLPK